MEKKLTHFLNACDMTTNFLGTLQIDRYYIDILETSDSHEAWMYEAHRAIKIAVLSIDKYDVETMEEFLTIFEKLFDVLLTEYIEDMTRYDSNYGQTIQTIGQLYMTLDEDLA